MKKLVCNHCRHHFQLEILEGAVCPSCGWSSSVVLATDFKEAKTKNSEKKNSKKPLHWTVGFLIFLIKVSLLIVVIAALVLGIRYFIQIQNSKNTTSEKLDKKAVSQISPKTKGTMKPDAVLPRSGKLTPNEEVALIKPIVFTDKPVVSDEDLKLLQRSIDMKAELVEKLPSSSWKPEEFKDYIEAQELKYKIPLPRGYKKSLVKLFESTYATAYEHFLQGRLQQSRDAYVASLAFPVYKNDARKHRAVVLTMMQGFLNDTIAKIGALNFSLARQGTLLPSQQVNKEYASFHQYIRSEKWGEALGVLRKIKSILPPDNQKGNVSFAPPYGPEFIQVDQDIKPSLSALLQVPAWPFNIQELKGDLSVKEMILEGLVDPHWKSSAKSYQQGMEAIGQKNWDEAISQLTQVKTPEDLAQDADDKISLIKRLVLYEKSQMSEA